MYFVIAGLIGALLAVMIYMNGVLAIHLGNYGSATVVHLTGLMLAAFMVLLRQETKSLQQRPSLVLFSGGGFGFVTVVFTNIGFIKLGVALTLSLGFLGQTLAGLVIDHFGWLGVPRVRFDRRKVGSVALIVGGLAIMVCCQ